MILKKINAFFNPAYFQGWGKQKNYFEGWYFKVLNADGSKAFAFIPGIAMDKEGNKQSFVQVLNGRKKTALYHKFPASDFKPSTTEFYVEVNSNSFSSSSISLNLPSAVGTLRFKGNQPWPNSFFSPGIMGPFSFVPFMECYHGIVSMDHSISGKLVIDDEEIDFENGRGYIEKDWGRSFPSAYIWLQSNHFSTPGISLKTSIAKIPWLGSSFVGFIAGLYIHDKLIQFTTYNRTSLKKSFADDKVVEIVLENNKYRLEIKAKRDQATALASPILGLMDGRIEESMSSEVEVKLYDKRNNSLIFHDIGKHTALEVAGKIDEIIVG
jgi:hypothetical protein